MTEHDKKDTVPEESTETAPEVTESSETPEPKSTDTPEETTVEEKTEEAVEDVPEAAAEEPVVEAPEVTESENAPSEEPVAPAQAEEESKAGELSEEDKELLQSPAPEPSSAPAEEEQSAEETPEETTEEEAAEPGEEEPEQTTHIFALRTTANREDQVLSFVGSNAARKKLPVYAAIAPHGMRGYIFLEAADIMSAEQSAQGVPYAKGVIPKEIEYKEIEHMLEQVKKDIKIEKNDIVEIIAGPFKREQAKISRVDKSKEEVVVELLEAAVPIPITLKLDDVKVIRREEE